MLFRPSNMIPSPFAGEGMHIIDATEDNIFSAQVNGTSPVVAYRLKIFENVAESDLVYDTDVVVLEEPFYGFTYKGEINLFTVEVPSTSGMVNGYANGYKWTLTLWWNYDSDYPDENCITSAEQYVEAKGWPSVEIDSFEPEVNSRVKEWTATYTSPNNIPIMWFEWLVASVEEDTLYTVIADTGKLYQSSELKYAFDGFANGQTYAVKVIVHNQDGIEVDSGWNEFTVSYTSVDISDVVSVDILSPHGVRIDWGKVQFIEGEATGNYTITEATLWWPGMEGRKILYLEPNATIEFSGNEMFDLSISKDSTHVWQGAIREDSLIRKWEASDSSFTWLLSHEGIYEGLTPYENLAPSETLAPMDVSGGQFTFTITRVVNSVPTTTVYTFKTTAPAHHWYTVIMRSTGLTVYEFDLPNGMWSGL